MKRTTQADLSEAQENGAQLAELETFLRRMYQSRLGVEVNSFALAMIEDVTKLRRKVGQLEDLIRTSED